MIMALVSTPLRRRAQSSSDLFRVHGHVCPLVGRDRELETLDAMLKRAIEYQAPQMVTVVGNQGTGKTRLLAEWTAGIEPPVRVYRGRARAGRYSAIAKLLRDRFGLAETDDPEATRKKFAESVQVVFGDRRVGEVVHFLGSYLDLRFHDSPFVRAFEDNPRQHDEIARAVLRRFFEIDASVSPIVLVLDDLESADDDTLTLIEELGEGLGGSPVMLVACARPELLVRRPRWGQGVGDFTRIELRNLDPERSAQMFRSLLQRCDGVSDELVEDAVEMTGGNPFFLEELVRVMIAAGTIDTSGPRWRIDPERAAETELPISVEEAIEARIAALSPEERDLLEKGATFGNVFWLSGVVALTRAERVLGDRGKTPPPPPVGWADDGLKDALARAVRGLVERDYLLELDAADSTILGDVEIVFKHNLERELVAKMTDEERRRRYHRIAAQWLETKLTDRSEEQFEFLAQLYERGGEPRRAAYCYIAGGDKARARYANEQAIEFYQKGLAMLDYDDAMARMEALHNLGDVLARVGRTDEAAVRFQEMLRIAWLFDYMAKGGAAHGRMGRLYRQRGDYDRALEHFQMAFDLFEAAGDRRGVAGALDDMGSIHWLRGDYHLALERHRKALGIRRALGDKRSIALSLANIGRVHHDSGSFKAAVEQFREALELRREIGDRPGVVSSLRDLGSVYQADGKLEAAQEMFEEALKIAREIGDRLLVAHVLFKIAEVLLEMSRSAEAAEALRQAEEIVVALGDRLGQAECARRSAEVSLVRGDHARALEQARRAMDLAERLTSKVHVALAHRVLGEVCGVTAATQLDRQRAEEHFRSSIEILLSLKNELELARTYRAFAVYRERTGMVADAQKLRARADEIFGKLRGAASLPG